MFSDAARPGFRPTHPAPEAEAFTGDAADTISPDAGPAGHLSSDGRYAALRGSTASGQSALHVVDLQTGRARRLPGATTSSNPNAQFAWTPNGRWLLTVTDHQIRAIEPRSGDTRTLRLDGDPVLHLTAIGAAG